MNRHLVWLVAIGLLAGCTLPERIRPTDTASTSSETTPREAGLPADSPAGGPGKDGAPSEGATVEPQTAAIGSYEARTGRGQNTTLLLSPRLFEALECWSLLEPIPRTLDRTSDTPGMVPLQTVDHPRVDAFVAYYLRGNGAYFRRCLARSSRYLPMIHEVFREFGLPEDLAYLSLIESGFDPHARSRSKAVGLWQFMVGTGRRYGLRIDWWMDERRDPVKATRAAARYLNDLYELFGSWELALAGYNAGEGKVGRCLERRNASSFWELCKYRGLKRETKDFVPKFYAALKIAKNPEKYGLQGIYYEEPYRWDRVEVGEPLDLDRIAQWLNTTPKKIRSYNPQFNRWCTPPGPPAVGINIPQGQKEILLGKISNLPLEERLHIKVHRVRSGETLAVIARRYGSPISLIQRLNRLQSIHRIRAGARLLIPTRKGGERRTVAMRTKSQNTSQPQNLARVDYHDGATGDAIVHKVKKGESLWSISQRYGVQISDIFRWNPIKNHRIRPGDELILRTGEI